MEKLKSLINKDEFELYENKGEYIDYNNKSYHIISAYYKDTSKVLYIEDISGEFASKETGHLNKLYKSADRKRIDGSSILHLSRPYNDVKKVEMTYQQMLKQEPDLFELKYSGKQVKEEVKKEVKEEKPKEPEVERYAEDDMYSAIDDRFSSYEKIRNFFNGFWSTSYIENFLDVWMIEDNGRVYMRLGDVGSTPEFREGIVADVKDLDGMKSVLIQSPFEDEYIDVKFTLVYENGKWVIKDNDFLPFNKEDY